jgi:long-chain acyl-CoA synthetase
MDFYNSFRKLIIENKISNKFAIIFKNRATTYGEILEQADRVGLGLYSHGVKKGDIIGIYMGNCPQILSIFLGIAKSGASAVPINILLTEYEITAQLEKAKPNIIFTSLEYLPIIERIKPFFPELKCIILGSEDSMIGKSFKSFLNAAEGIMPEIPMGGEDVVLIPFTGGTTGQAKGVMLTHRNLLSVIEGQINRLGSLGEMVTLCAAPLSHIYGLNTLTFASLFRKSCVVLEEWFNTEEAAQLIESYRISFLSGVPTVVRNLLQVASRYDLKSIRIVSCGAAPVPEDLYHLVEKNFDCLLLEGWGLTEGAGNAIKTPPGVKKIGSCGLPYENIGLKCAIFGKDGNPLPANQIGELVQSGSLTMKGYLQDPEGTKKVIRKGWLHTGDLARTDEDGYFYIVDRIKDVIIRGGFNVYPAEVEATLYSIPSIQEAAVFGVSDAKKGETVAAAVRLKAGLAISEEEIISHCRLRLARFKVPKYIKFINTPFPKTATGKIQRGVLKEEFEKKRSNPGL